MKDAKLTQALSRRKMLLAAGVGTTAALAAPSIATAQTKIARLTTTWSRTSRGYHESAQRLADRITAATNGSVTVELNASGELFPAFESLFAVQRGEAEMFHAISGYWRKEHPGFQFLNTVPNGFTCEENGTWLREGGARPLMDELYARYNIKALVCGGSGVQPGGWFAKPIESLSDMSGLRMRISGYGGEVVRRVGGTPVSLPADALVDALFNGDIDAVEWNGPLADKGFGFQKLLPYYMQPGFHDPGSSITLGLNQQFWDSLTPSERTIIEACCATESAITMAEFRGENGRSLIQLVNEYDAKLTILPADVWLEAARMAEDVIAEAAEFDDLSMRIYDSYIDFRKKLMPWSAHSIERYSSLRQTWIDDINTASAY